MEEAVFVQPALFPISALLTEGYAEPEPREEAATEDDQADVEDAA
ncbi:hypothetical protein [Streptomyces sp. NPDC048252]